jgi:hypothetical protein
MSTWLDKKYISLLSSQLDRFAWKKADLAQFRCPLCGDSETNKAKARGYVYASRRDYMYKCHNCSVALPFVALLKRVCRPLYDEYLLERVRDEQPPESPPQNTLAAPPRVVVPSTLPTPLSECSSPQHALHSVYQYARNRQIPEAVLHRLAATNTAQTWLAPIVGDDKSKKVDDGVPHLVCPLTLCDGTWYGAQLRDITAKYYSTFRWSHEPLKMFGLDGLHDKSSIYVVEGPIDALFLPNAIAACASDLMGAMHIVEELRLLPPFAGRVYVWDNEPRNKEVCRLMRNAIALHESIVIWPSDWPKDINDMIVSGLSLDTIRETILRRTFSGLQAELEFTAWHK